MRLLEPATKKMNEDRPILSAAKVQAIESSFWGHKVCADIRRGSLETDDSGVIENVDFHGFWSLHLWHLRK